VAFFRVACVWVSFFLQFFPIRAEVNEDVAIVLPFSLVYIGVAIVTYPCIIDPAVLETLAYREAFRLLKIWTSRKSVSARITKEYFIIYLMVWEERMQLSFEK
jgi:hypothetical protein